MRFLSYAVPLAVFTFFLVRSRRSPIYLISLPLVLAFGGAIYLDIYTLRVVVGGVGLELHDILLILQLLGWWYIALKRPHSQPIAKNVGYWGALMVLSYYFVIMIYSLPSLERLLSRAILGFPRLFYLPLGFLIMLDTYRRFSRDEVMMWLRDLSAVTVFLSVLYILNSLYPGSVYEIAGADVYDPALGIVRSYSSFPYWLLLAWIYLISSPVLSLGKWASVGILLLSSVFYYSRAFLLIAICLIMGTTSPIFPGSYHLTPKDSSKS